MGINIENNRIVINPIGVDVNKFAVPEKITTAETSFACKEPVFSVGDDGKLFGGDMAAFARLEQIKSQIQCPAVESGVTEMSFPTANEVSPMMVSGPDMCC